MTPESMGTPGEARALGENLGALLGEMLETLQRLREVAGIWGQIQPRVDEIERWRGEITLDLDKRFEATVDRNDALENRLLERLRSLEKNLGSLSAKIDVLMGEISQLRESSVETNRALADLATEFRAHAAAANGQIATLRRDLEATEKEAGDLFADLETRIEDTLARVKSLEDLADNDHAPVAPVALHLPHSGPIAPDDSAEFDFQRERVSVFFLMRSTPEKAAKVDARMFLNCVSELEVPVGEILCDGAGTPVELRGYAGHEVSDVLDREVRARKVEKLLEVLEGSPSFRGAMFDNWSLSPDDRGIFTAIPVGYTRDGWNLAMIELAAGLCFGTDKPVLLNIGSLVGPDGDESAHVDAVNAVARLVDHAPRVWIERWGTTSPGRPLLDLVQQFARLEVPADCYCAVPFDPSNPSLWSLAAERRLRARSAIFVALVRPGDTWGVSADPEGGFPDRASQVSVTNALLETWGTPVSKHRVALGRRLDLRVPESLSDPWLVAEFEHGALRVNLVTEETQIS